MRNRMTPIVKWAGGKTQLLGELRKRMPEKYGTYYEPFVGGAAMLLDIAPEKAVAGDINAQLINLYDRVKNEPDRFIRKIKEYDSVECDAELYYKMRDRYNFKIASGQLDVETAALMVWINKHCFNGLYRVNSKGRFNVPYNNKKTGMSIDEDNISAINDYLSSADVSMNCCDFEEVCSEVKSGDFVYFDSPYLPESETADFTAYSKNGFGMDEHIRLADLFRELDGRGAKVMLSNNNVPLVYELYKGYRTETVSAKRAINRDASKRTGSEVIITNY